MLTELEISTLRAALARILPSGGGVAAEEQGCLSYILAVVEQAGPTGWLAREVTRGLRLMDQLCIEAIGKSFAQAAEAEQDRVLDRMEKEGSLEANRFLGRLVYLSIEGLFCDPPHGAKPVKSGWRWLEIGPEQDGNRLLVTVQGERCTMS